MAKVTYPEPVEGSFSVVDQCTNRLGKLARESIAVSVIAKPSTMAMMLIF